MIRRIGVAAFRIVVPFGAGALVALSLPPVGIWPLAIIGVAILARFVEGRTFGWRAAAGLFAGLGQFSIGLAWAIQFSYAGYGLLIFVESCFFVLALALTPPRRGRLPAIVGLLTLAELARERWPFGGVPLGGVALGQAGEPLAVTARFGGSLMLAGVTYLAGVALGELARALPTWRRYRPLEQVNLGLPDASSSRPAGPLARIAGFSEATIREQAAGLPNPRRLRWSERAAHDVGIGLVAVIILLGFLLFGALAPDGGPTVRVLRAAVVQGGGGRGLSQLQVPTSVAYDATMRQARRLRPPLGLVVMPEDVVALNGPLAHTRQHVQLAALAERLHCTVVVGLTRPIGAKQFVNEVVAFGPTGEVVAGFIKVHLVPFGEYVPWRPFVRVFANLADVPRDAIAGHASGMIETPAGRLALLISFEVFFGERGRSGVKAGGELVLVPTNTSSYASAQPPAQELAAARLQAISTGRYVLQAATVGYSAVVNNDGDVLESSTLGEPATIIAYVPLRDGRTIYVRLGDLPVIALAAFAVLLGWTRAWRAHPHAVGVPRSAGGQPR